MEVVGEAGTAEEGLRLIRELAARRRHPRRAPARRQRHRGVPGDPVGAARCPLPDADVVLRRRRPVLLDHGGRVGLRPQGGRRRRPPRRHPPGEPGHVAPRPRPDPGALRPPAQGPGGRVAADRPHPAGTPGAGADRPGPVEPPDRRAALPGRGHGQELRLEPAVEARACVAGPRRPSTPRSWPSARPSIPGPEPSRLRCPADREAAQCDRATRRWSSSVRKSTPAPRSSFSSRSRSTRGLREPRRVALDAHGGAEPQQHAVVVELERQVLGHDVARRRSPWPVEPASALQKITTSSSRDAGNGSGSMSAHRPASSSLYIDIVSSILPELGSTTRADTPVLYRADTPSPRAADQPVWDGRAARLGGPRRLCRQPRAAGGARVSSQRSAGPGGAVGPGQHVLGRLGVLGHGHAERGVQPDVACPPTTTGSSSVCWSRRIRGPTACSSVTATTTTSSLPADPADGVLGPQHRGEPAGPSRTARCSRWCSRGPG